MLESALHAIGCIVKADNKVNRRKPCQEPDGWEILRFYQGLGQ
ncbi:MAG: hypothetical protein ACYC3S_10865 [Chloroflexota bacterium]